MGLKHIVELDLKKQTLASFGWMTVIWYDQFLPWDTAQFPIRIIHLSLDLVWNPHLLNLNAGGDLDQLEDQKKTVIVDPAGRVVWYPGGLFKTFCSINIFHYSFDTQTC